MDDDWWGFLGVVLLTSVGAFIAGFCGALGTVLALEWMNVL